MKKKGERRKNKYNEGTGGKKGRKEGAEQKGENYYSFTMQRQNLRFNLNKRAIFRFFFFEIIKQNKIFLTAFDRRVGWIKKNKMASIPVERKQIFLAKQLLKRASFYKSWVTKKKKNFIIATVSTKIIN